MAFSPSNKHCTSVHNFSDSVASVDGSFTESLTVSGVPVSISAPIPSLPFQKLDATHSPVALYNFEDDRTDSSGNGLDLVVTTGVERYTTIQGLRAFSCNGAERLTHVAGTALEITGDITIELLLASYRRSATETFIAYSLDTDSSATYNILYQISHLNTGSSLNWLHEDAGMGNHGWTQYSATMPLGTLTHIAAVRSGNEVTFYIDGVQAGASSGVLGQAANGTASVLNIGADGNNGNHFVGAIASVKIIDSALSSAEILAEYNLTLGNRRRALVPAP